MDRSQPALIRKHCHWKEKDGVLHTNNECFLECKYKKVNGTDRSRCCPEVIEIFYVFSSKANRIGNEESRRLKLFSWKTKGADGLESLY